MIKRFSLLYVGHVRLDNVGRDGTPADARRYSNEKFIAAYEDGVRVAQALDELGFHAFWLAEHHFQHEGYEVIPNILLYGTYLATQTKRLKIGCAFSIVPLWHPLRLAEDFALADILTRGRIIFGVGRGYQTREVETFGAPMRDNDANLELFQEQVEIIFKAFNQASFHHEGKHYTLPARVPFRGYEVQELTLVPRPRTLPVETWMPIASGRTVDYIAKMGFKGIIFNNGERLVAQLVEQFTAASARYGRPLQPGQDLALGFSWYIADTFEEARRRFEPYHDERFKWFAPFGFVRYVDDEGRVWGSPGAPARVPTVDESLAQRAVLVGSPDDIIARLKELERRYPGLEEIWLHWPEGEPPEEQIAQLERFARDVMPAFR